MTEPIAVESSGDCWNNPTQFQQQLNQHPANEPLILDLRSEGPSIRELGITDVIDAWLTAHQLPPENVQLTRWSNPVEFVPYQRVKCSKISHFFIMVRDYWQHTEPALEQQLQYQQPFGIFIGRLTMSRAAILYKLLLDAPGSIRQQIFPSLMKNVAPYQWHRSNEDCYYLDSWSDWLLPDEQVSMFDWYDRDSVASIDNKTTRDHYVSTMSYVEMNNSLLQHYQKFAVEIVCETYTQGNTFFPTEKTARPLMAAKPILVYGPQYYLARLRGMGFRTYHEIWDESYDLYQGPKRWHLMRKSMNTLLERSRSDQHVVLAQAYEIARHNRRHLEKICTHQIDLTKHDYQKI
jgi:hypothetical protein